MTDLRTAAQQALEALEEYQSKGAPFLACDGAVAALRAALAQQDELQPMPPEQRQRWEELAAMPQQAEPAQDIHGACPTHCCPVHGCKYMHDDCPVVSGAVQPVYPRNNGCESCADEAEPLNLSDRAVRRRLATQWGYVPAAQAEPAQEPVAWMYDCGGGGRMYAEVLDGVPGWTPLYTAPPQLQPLTEEEKRALADKFLSCQPESYEVSGVFDLISAVERAHGIKE